MHEAEVGSRTRTNGTSAEVKGREFGAAAGRNPESPDVNGTDRSQERREEAKDRGEEG